MTRTVLLLALLACKGDKHQLPKVEGSNAPAPLPSTTATTKEQLDKAFVGMFGSATTPDLEGEIAKLEAQAKAAPEAERALIQRSIKIMRATDAADREADRAKARTQRIAIQRDTFALLQDTAKFAPDDVDTIAAVCGSMKVLAATIESMGIEEELPIPPILERMRALAAGMVKTNPNSAKAWGVLASVSPYDDYELRLKAYSRCAALDPANQPCAAWRDIVRTEFVAPYCEAADVRPGLAWHAATDGPAAGATPFTYRGRTLHLGPARFTGKDVERVRFREVTNEHHQADGTVTKETFGGVDIELRKPEANAMIDWTREVVKRKEATAMVIGTRVLVVDDQAMRVEGSPGMMNEKLETFCAKTKTRTLPADL